MIHSAGASHLSLPVAGSRADCRAVGAVPAGCGVGDTVASHVAAIGVHSIWTHHFIVPVAHCWARGWAAVPILPNRSAVGDTGVSHGTTSAIDSIWTDHLVLPVAGCRAYRRAHCSEWTSYGVGEAVVTHVTAVGVHSVRTGDVRVPVAGGGAEGWAVVAVLAHRTRVRDAGVSHRAAGVIHSIRTHHLRLPSAGSRADRRAPCTELSWNLGFIFTLFKDIPYL